MSKRKEAITELLLELTEPTMKDMEGKLRAQATARLKCIPAGNGEREVEARFLFTAPMGPIEREELSWYLERYHSWPSGVFQERAKKMEALLPVWGKGLFDAVFSRGEGQLNDVLREWQKSADNGGERRFTVYVDKQLPAADGGAKDESQGALANALEAATRLLTLPWELLNDGTGYLFQGDSPVQVRRRLPNTRSMDTIATEPPIRVLLVSPRPEDEQAGYFDHRISALPLVSALESLGELAELTILTPPTFEALGRELLKAKQEGTPYHVVHFDGHGAFVEEPGIGGLCFEDPQDIEKLQQRNPKFIDANVIGAVMRDYGIPLVFLDACQSAKTDKEPGASVAATLLHHGVASVVAMSHTVLVETTRRFDTAFYRQLAQGQRVGEAMSAGRRELQGDPFRFNIFGAGKLELQDWFVPVLYQEKEDVQLFTDIRSRPAKEIDKKVPAARMEYLPAEPAHCFVGRSRKLLMLERLLALEKVNYAVVVGQGGEGKTTLAVELARWLVRTGRYKRAVFVCMEDIYDVRTVVDQIGRQLLPNFSVAEYDDAKKALLPIEGQLKEEPTLVLLDNMESILPPKDMEQAARLEPEALEEFFAMCGRLNAVADTGFLFTSREALPKPFDSGRQTVTLSRLDKKDAINLVHQAMTEAGLQPQEEDDGAAQPEVEALVESVNCHARSLVLLVPYISQLGVRHTTENLGSIMEGLHKKYPDERERSLFASIELSLERLARQLKKKIKPLGAFQGGGHISNIEYVLQLSEDERNALVQGLIQMNLAEPVDYNFLRFHPALCPFLWEKMRPEEQKESTARWAEGMVQLIQVLYQKSSEESQLVADLTTMELPNLMRLLDHVRAQEDPGATVDLATALEQFIKPLGRPHLLAQVATIREAESKKLGDWDHTRVWSSIMQIDRLLDSGNLPQALSNAQKLLKKCLQEGENAYEEASYDTAYIHWKIGGILNTGGASEAALQSIDEAYRRFQRLVDQGNTSAAQMASASLTAKGSCLLSLGRLQEASAIYEAGIQIDEKQKRFRSVAVGKGQLGRVLLKQKRCEDALNAFKDSREIFEELGELASVAANWHLIGMVHEESNCFEAAEQAYRQSLTINVQQNNPASEANCLGQLGNLYDKMGRLEEAATCYRQAGAKSVELGDNLREGNRRRNLAVVLIKLKHYDEARQEIQRAIECEKSYGHASAPWKSWKILHNLEQEVGNGEVADRAWQRAIQLYLAYRRDGGENHEGRAKLCSEVLQAIQENKTEMIDKALAALANYQIPSSLKALKTLVPKLQAIRAGSRDPRLAEDPELDYDDAAEILFLLEKLS